MAEIIKLSIDLSNDAAVLSSLANIDALVSRLNGTRIKIGFDTGAAQKVEKSAIQMVNAQARLETATAKTTAAQAKQATAEAKVALQQEKTATLMAKTTAAAEKQAAAVQKAGKSSSLFGDSLGRVAAKMAAWQLMGNAVSGVINSFKEALSTMKEVDTELTAIQKVTNMSDSQIAALGKSSYKTASQYGVGANEYLQNIGTFSKAGYQDAAQGLGELAIKTQLVGDVSAETASQFLLSTDAAFKYKGSVTQLSGVLDKANAVENNFATSIEKIAEGMPIVANVAATAGMSMDETIAMLGTITAVTQESGTKAATAARALILNIMGDTTTEIEEGVSLTTEQVKSLSDILWKYSGDAMKAAQATGSIVNPMEAIAGLAKASQEGLLTEAELATIASSIGGKLRTNQLLALINNFDMFTDQLETMKGAAGSADKEVDTMLGSWESKSNILKNSWTELVSTFVSTDFVKGGMDGLTGFVQGLTSLLTPAIDKARTASEELNASLKEEFGVGSRYDELRNKIEALTEAEKQELAVLEARKLARQAEAEAAENAEYQTWQNTYGYGKNVSTGYDTFTTQDQQTLLDISDKLSNANNNLLKTDNIKAYQTELEKVERTYASMYADLLEFQAQGRDLTWAQEQFIQLYESIGRTSDELANSGDQVNALAQNAYTMAIAAGKSSEEAMKISEDTTREYLQTIGLIPKKVSTEYDAVTQAAVDASLNYLEMLGMIPEEKTIDFEDNSEEAIENAQAVGKAADAAAGERQITYTINTSTAGTGFGFGGDINPDQIISGSSAAGTKSAPGGPTLVNEQGPELISANGLAYIAGGGKPTITNLPRGAIVLNAGETRRAMGSLRSMGPMRAYKEGTSGEDILKSAMATVEKAGMANYEAYRIAQLEKFQTIRANGNTTGSVTTGGSGSGWYGGGGSNAPAGPDFKALESELDELLDNLDLQIKLAQNQNDRAKELSLQATAAEKIKDLVEKYQAAGYSDTSNEVLKLLNKGYGYSDDIMGKLVDAIEDAANATSKANALEEQRLKVEEANTALSNAQKQRTVRVFNSETGQWEWIADQSMVKSAQDSLKSAQESYKKEQQNELIDALKNANIGDLEDLVLGEGILASLNDNPELLSAFANALGAVSGAADRTAGAKGESIFKSSDSHDTIYEFPGGITLTEEQAKTTTLKQLADQLRVLKLV